MIVKIDPEIIPYSKEVQNLCAVKYYKHPNGCPNYGKRDSCPPNQPLINEVLDFEKDVYLIYIEFDVGNFAKRMWDRHPNWTERQAYNPRLWQPRARKYLREEEQKAREEYNLEIIDKSPEARGVNLNLLFKRIGVELEWPPRKITRVASLGGFELI